MSSRSVRFSALLLVALSIGLTVLLEVRETASGSALSVSSRGWFLARRYLEERGHSVKLLDAPLHDAAPTGVLVLVFPLQRAISENEQSGIQQHLLAGGTILFGYSGAGTPAEKGALRWLGLTERALRGPPPLGYLAWRDHANEEWTLAPAEGIDAPPLRVSAISWAPQGPAGARALYDGPSGDPVIFSFSILNGRVVVLPSEVLSNARLLERGNADLLETLASSLDAAWSFDEYHHGLSAPLTPERTRPRYVLDLFLVQLGLVYLLAVDRLSRSFGPVFPEPVVATGSTRTFLLGLGSLHDRLGHHAEAAQLMVERARELQPRIELEETGVARTGAELVELGIRVASRQDK